MPRHPLAILLSLSLLAGWAAQALADDFSLPALPREADSLAGFIPKGWGVQEQASGDLNKDGIADIAAILIEDKKSSGEDEEFDLQRALLIVLGNDRQKFQLGGGNGKLLVCNGCGGVKESVGIGIEKGVAVVEQMTGSREFSDQTWRFRYDAATRRFLLIGMDLVNVDSILGTGNKASRNYLTGLTIKESFKPDASGERSVTTTSKKEKGQPKTVFLEDVE